MKYPLSFIILFISIVSQAQINKNTKWGQVSQEEIQYSDVNFEPGASAVILYETGFMFMKKPIQTKVYRRIKILNEHGLKQANISLGFEHHEKLQNISGLRAQTLNQEGGKTVNYPLKNSDFYTKQLNDYHSSISFTFPNVKVGSIIEYEYTFNNDNIRWIEAWQFQHEIPTVFSKFSIDPENLLAGFATIAVGENFSKTPKKRDGFNQHEYSMSNLKSFSNVDFAYNNTDQAEKLILQLKSYYATQNSYYNTSPQLMEITTKWTDLLKEVENRQNSFTNNSFAKTLLAEIPKGSDKLSYLQNISDYFQKNYRWNGLTSTVPIPQSSNRQVHNDKIGTLPDLNLHLYSILKAAGFDTSLVILSTRNHGKIITTYPYLGQFNAVVNMVKFPTGEIYFLDASNLSNGLGFMPKNNYNQVGLIVNSKQENFISINSPVSELHISQNYAFTNNQITAVSTQTSNGFFNEQNFVQSSKIKPSLDVEFVEKSKTNPTSIATKYLGFRTTSQSENINQEFYTIQNPLNTILQEFKFTEQARERSLEFDFPLMYKIQTIVKIPEGYKVEIPSNFNSVHNVQKEDLAYSQKAELKDGELQIVYEFLLGKAIIANQYQAVKSFFEKVNVDAQKSILLKKN
ncbi:DUF3857 domain-containing protein [Moheibacter stercoris]|uniref:DUF3857 domain-containing protein n=1 Tax=Moheibacter stercoris TaxID=1628251 RepID=A0ABV2LTK1_9FLAO